MEIFHKCEKETHVSKKRWKKLAEKAHIPATVSGRRASVSPPTSDNEWDGPCSCCNMTMNCKCGLEAEERESNDNYRRRYMRCPKRVSVGLVTDCLF